MVCKEFPNPRQDSRPGLGALYFPSCNGAFVCVKFFDKNFDRHEIIQPGRSELVAKGFNRFGIGGVGNEAKLVHFYVRDRLSLVGLDEVNYQLEVVLFG